MIFNFEFWCLRLDENGYPLDPSLFRIVSDPVISLTDIRMPAFRIIEDNTLADIERMRDDDFFRILGSTLRDIALTD
jgi:hypothetical protein